MTLTAYRTANLGDAIQTLAASTVTGPARGIFREAFQETDWGNFTDLFLVNGWHADPLQIPPPLAGRNALFAGFHTDQPAAMDWCRASRHPVGARDPATRARLQAAGVRSVLTGCLTMLLPRYSGSRTGVISVDLPGGPGAQLTHDIQPTGWPAAWAAAVSRLAVYQTAAEVHTSRLHVALPCLAMGTPVRLVPWPELYHTVRMGAWAWLGCPFGELVVRDTAEFTGPLLSLLADGLGRPVRLGPPVCPAI